MIDATTLDDRSLAVLREAVDAAQAHSPVAVLVYGYEVELREIGDACHCCDHACDAGEAWYEAVLVGRLHGRQVEVSDDTLGDVLDELRTLLGPHRRDTEAGRERCGREENARTGLQPPLIVGAG